MEESTPSSPSFGWDTCIYMNVTPKRNNEQFVSSSVFMSPIITPTSTEKISASSRAGPSCDGDPFANEEISHQQLRTPAGDEEMDAFSSATPEASCPTKTSSRKRCHEDTTSDAPAKHICNMNAEEINKFERDEMAKRLSMAPRKRNCTVWFDAPSIKIGRSASFACADCPRCLSAFERIKPTDSRPVQRRLEF